MGQIERLLHSGKYDDEMALDFSSAVFSSKVLLDRSTKEGQGGVNVVSKLCDSKPFDPEEVALAVVVVKSMSTTRRGWARVA